MKQQLFPLPRLYYLRIFVSSFLLFHRSLFFFLTQDCCRLPGGWYDELVADIKSQFYDYLQPCSVDFHRNSVCVTLFYLVFNVTKCMDLRIHIVLPESNSLSPSSVALFLTRLLLLSKPSRKRSP